MNSLIDTRWAWAAVIDWVIVFAAICVSYWSIYLLPLSILIVGNRMHALSILGHDGGHQTVCRRNRGLNDFLANLMVFWPLGVNMKRYREFHFAHHRHTGDPEKDPEMPLKELPPLPMKAPFTNKKVALHSFLDLFGAGAIHMVCFLYIVRPEIWAVPLMFPVIATFLGFPLAAVIWAVSSLTSFAAVFRLRVYSEHIGCPEGETHELNPAWWQKLLYLPHNTWCHDVHHRYPSISFADLNQSRTKP